MLNLIPLPSKLIVPMMMSYLASLANLGTRACTSRGCFPGPRPVLAGIPRSKSVWQWENENGTWESYDAGVQLLIETKFKAGNSPQRMMGGKVIISTDTFQVSQTTKPALDPRTFSASWLPMVHLQVWVS